MKILTLVQAGAIVKRDPATLRQAILRGSLQAVKRGRDWFVRESELRRYITATQRSEKDD